MMNKYIIGIILVIRFLNLGQIRYSKVRGGRCQEIVRVYWFIDEDFKEFLNLSLSGDSVWVDYLYGSVFRERYGYVLIQCNNIYS